MQINRRVHTVMSRTVVRFSLIILSEMDTRRGNLTDV